MVDTNVSYTSAVKIYKTENAHEIAAFAIINSAKTMRELAFGVIAVAIVVNAVTTNKMNISFRRGTQFSNGIATNSPGISTAVTMMKLMYRSAPGICVDVKLKP